MENCCVICQSKDAPILITHTKTHKFMYLCEDCYNMSMDYADECYHNAMQEEIDRTIRVVDIQLRNKREDDGRT